MNKPTIPKLENEISTKEKLHKPKGMNSEWMNIKKIENKKLSFWDILILIILIKSKYK